jgi:hypothetical protein
MVEQQPCKLTVEGSIPFASNGDEFGKLGREP